MYTLGNTKVSGGHKVWYQDEFIPVADHPDAVRTADSKNLVCINTDLRYFTIENYIFMDFTEFGPVSGLAGSTLIAPSLQISEVHIGDILNGEVVRGTVMHAVNEKTVLYNLITDKSLESGKVEKY